jgi:tetratricopeptide (TPR) repeat protein
MRRRILGPSHPDTIWSMHRLANVLHSQGRLEEARKVHDEELQLYRRSLGPEHRLTLHSMSTLALLLRDQGRLDEALRLLEQTLMLQRRILGAEAPNTLSSMSNLALMLYQQGRLEEALKLFDEAFQLHRRSRGPEHRQTLRSMLNLAVMLDAQERWEEALRLNGEALQLCRRVLGPHDPVTLVAMNVQAMLLARAGDPKFRDPPRAVQLAKEVVTQAPKNPNYWNTLGVAQYSAGDWKAAIAALEKSMELGKGGDSGDWFYLAMAHWQLGKTGVGSQKSEVGGEKLTAQERAQHLVEARRWYDKAVQWMEKNRPKHPELQAFRKEAAALLGLAEAKK